ncbi:hypothetical protein Enr10x_31710 [Gimesia panareensis]|uniref:YqcC-like domain-containing protein n=2 Tax=Gimesia panareensis TaxID=2527978 RepID=A0A517Q895_9PLAN|nr:hypothetical protein Enr10x_31710 [Gimesia panareensis]
MLNSGVACFYAGHHIFIPTGRLMVSKQATDKDALVLAKLDEIEAELKRIGFWSETPEMTEPANFLEAPSFELWLQCVFLPHAREAAGKGTYPERSQVGLMALRQYDYHSYVPEAQTLLKLLHEFDRLIENE